MKQLTCEMCGSTDLLKQEGVFVCQTCGTKYSVEEAKKMMIEGTVDVSGSSVKIDNTDSVNTYMSMAENAYNASNTAEAEAYCNRVIEIDPQNYDAWMLKGQSAGWQSSLGNIRLGEAISCFLNAIKFAPEEPQPIKLDLMGIDVDATVDIRQRIIDKATEEIKNISVALVKLQGERFAKWPDKEESTRLTNLIKDIMNSVSVIENMIKEPLNIAAEVAIAINNSVMTAWNNVVVSEYKEAGQYPSDDDYKTMLDRAGFCSFLLIYAITFSGEDDDKSNIVRYQNLIAIENYCIANCGYAYEYYNFDQFVRYDHTASEKRHARQRAIDIVKKVGGIPDVYNNRYWLKNTHLTDTAVQDRKNNIAKYNEGIKKCQKRIEDKKRAEEARKVQEQKERNEKYWTEHVEEKQQLEDEWYALQSQLKQLQGQVAPYDSEIDSLKKKREADTPAQEEKKTVENQIASLRNEQSMLGLFKGKEKKALQSQIDELNARISTINESIEIEKGEQLKMCDDKIREIEQTAKPIKDKIAVAQNRINEINHELTKNR